MIFVLPRPRDDAKVPFTNEGLVKEREQLCTSCGCVVGVRSEGEGRVSGDSSLYRQREKRGTFTPLLHHSVIIIIVIDLLAKYRWKTVFIVDLSPFLKWHATLRWEYCRDFFFEIQKRIIII